MARLLLIEAPDLDASILYGTTASAGFDWLQVADESAAFRRLERERFSLILAGMNVSHDPLAFLTRLRQWHPRIPVVVVMDHQSEATLRDVLQTGVAGFLPKQNLSTDLSRTIQILLRTNHAGDDEIRVCYTLNNIPDLLPLIVSRISGLIQGWQFSDPLEPARITVALTEALNNALYHGNLELSSALRQGDGSGWRRESQRRRDQPPYRDRRIRFHATISKNAATFTIADEGTGFNPSERANCTDPENLELCSGRGLMLMHKYMDQVTYNASGNEVTLVKYRPVPCM